MGHLDDVADRVDRTDRVRREPNRNHSGARPERTLQARQVQRAIGSADAHPAHDHAALLFQGQPRRDVGVVIQPCHDDLVAGSQSPTYGPADGEGQAGHVLAEGDLVGSCADEVGCGAVSLGQDRVAFLAGWEGPVVVCVGPLEVAGNGPDRAARDLRPAGSVEVAVHPAAVLAGEGRELGPDGRESLSRSNRAGRGRRLSR